MFNKYVKVYNEVLSMKKLTATEKLLYSILITLSKDFKKPVYASNHFLGLTLDCSEETIKRGLKTLKTLKLIETTNKNKYRVIEVLPPVNYEVFTEPVKKPDKISEEVEEVLERLFNRL